MSAQAKPMATIDREAWLANRLGKHGVLIELFAGATDPQGRKTKLRSVIKARGLDAVIAGVARDGTSTANVTYAQAFERVYGEKL